MSVTLNRKESQMIAWMTANWGMLAAVALGISESLALLFPSQSGFGGLLAGMIKFLKMFGIKDPMGK